MLSSLFSLLVVCTCNFHKESLNAFQRFEEADDGDLKFVYTRVICCKDSVRLDVLVQCCLPIVVVAMSRSLQILYFNFSIYLPVPSTYPDGRPHSVFAPQPSPAWRESRSYPSKHPHYPHLRPSLLGPNTGQRRRLNRLT